MDKRLLEDSNIRLKLIVETATNSRKYLDHLQKRLDELQANIEAAERIMYRKAA